jgi:hypothetical protein
VPPLQAIDIKSATIATIAYEYKKSRDANIATLMNYIFITGPVEYENNSLVVYQQSDLNFRLICENKSYNIITVFKKLINLKEEKEIIKMLKANKDRFKKNYDQRKLDPAIAGRSYEALLHIETKLMWYSKGGPVVIWAEHNDEECRASFSFQVASCNFQPQNNKIQFVLDDIDCDNRNICKANKGEEHTIYIMINLNSGNSEAKGFDLLSVKQIHSK